MLGKVGFCLLNGEKAYGGLIAHKKQLLGKALGVGLKFTATLQGPPLQGESKQGSGSCFQLSTNVFMNRVFACSIRVTASASEDPVSHIPLCLCSHSALVSPHFLWAV